MQHFQWKLSYMYTGWRNPIGCLKLQVIFRKRATSHGAVLRKKTYNEDADALSLQVIFPQKIYYVDVDILY